MKGKDGGFLHIKEFMLKRKVPLILLLKIKKGKRLYVGGAEKVGIIEIKIIQ